MRSAGELHRGWLFRERSCEDLWIMVDLLMSGAVNHVFMKRDGFLRSSSFEEVMLRQGDSDNVRLAWKEESVLKKARKLLGNVP